MCLDLPSVRGALPAVFLSCAVEVVLGGGMSDRVWEATDACAVRRPCTHTHIHNYTTTEHGTAGHLDTRCHRKRVLARVHLSAELDMAARVYVCVCVRVCVCVSSVTSYSASDDHCMIAEFILYCTVSISLTPSPNMCCRGTHTHTHTHTHTTLVDYLVLGCKWDNCRSRSQPACLALSQVM